MNQTLKVKREKESRLFGESSGMGETLMCWLSLFLDFSQASTWDQISKSHFLENLGRGNYDHCRAIRYLIVPSNANSAVVPSWRREKQLRLTLEPKISIKRSKFTCINMVKTNKLLLGFLDMLCPSRACMFLGWLCSFIGFMTVVVGFCVKHLDSG